MSNQTINRAYINRVKSTVNDELLAYGLDSYDFEFDFISDEKNHIFSITHRDYSEEIYFKAYSTDFKLATIKLAPDELLSSRSFNVDFKNSHTHIRDWVGCLVAELNAIKEEEIESKAEQIKTIIAPHLKQCITSPEDFFSDSELSSLRERLDSLEAQFNVHREAFNLTQESLEALKGVISEIKELAKGEVQQRWYDKTLDKLGVWASKIEKIDRVVKAIEKGANLLEKASNITDVLPPL